jgi:hypothetical protein
MAPRIGLGDGAAAASSQRATVAWQRCSVARAGAAASPSRFIRSLAGTPYGVCIHNSVTPSNVHKPVEVGAQRHR